MDIAGKLPPSQLKKRQRAIQSEICAMEQLKGRATPDPACLTFGELEPFARALLAVLLALVGARVASEEAELLQPGPQLRIELHQSSRNAQTGGPRLTGDA